jgi:hypothetical protein
VSMAGPEGGMISDTSCVATKPMNSTGMEVLLKKSSDE